ncbi:MAG: aminotransferase class III-fold pyridoxal phosphate-dependent enzyme [Candidatus Aminicenantes bacterium]|nr:aminotransferase class III-fold pyridoxal phosphate-dependent enzyme [Candidatus Aminicenantes bacterium]
MMREEFPRPKFDLREARKIARELFGLEAEVEYLSGYSCRNFYLRDRLGREFVLKISNRGETRDELDLQNKAMEFLASKLPQIKFPRVLAALNGEQINEVEGRDGHKYLVRLLTYVPGEVFSCLEKIPPFTWKELGQLLGLIDQALLTFSHPASHREIPWDLKNVLWSKERLKFIADKEKRRLIEFFLTQLELRILPEVAKLRQSVIYNDANENNLIISRKNSGQPPRITGLIDFGDMVETYVAAEIAIALTYAMMNKVEPFEVGTTLLSAYHQTFSLKPEEINLLPDLIIARLCISLTMSAWRQREEPTNKYISISARPAWALLNFFLETNPEKIRRLFLKACGIKPVSSIPSKKEILAKRKRYFSAALSLAYKRPLHLIRGALQYLYDAAGKTYLDAVNNVCHLGHCHPKVVKAVSQQMSLLNTNTRYLYEWLGEYAEKLTAKLPPELRYVFLVNSGSEANDLALRLAFNFTGGTEVIVIDGAYHGNLTSLIAISPYKFDGPGGKGAPPYVHKVMTPDPYRGPYRYNDERAGEKYALEVKKKVEIIKASGKKLACFIFESVMGCAGQIFFPSGYLKKALEYVREAGGICIADEVQIGFGRLGDHFWGFETQGIVPDLVTLGKPIGNGHPLGAVITTEEIARSFVTGMEYFNTYGGNPVSCAAGLAVLEAIEEEELPKKAKQVGAYLKKGLKQLQKEHELIGDVRGQGLFLGVELVRDRTTLEPATEETRYVVEKMKDFGVLVSPDGPWRNVIKIKPPLVFNERNADQLIEALHLSLTQKR